MFRPATHISPIERSVIAGPCKWSAVALRGAGKRDRAEADTLEEVLALAPLLYGNDGRAVGIYAHNEAGRTAMVGAWEPDHV